MLYIIIKSNLREKKEIKYKISRWFCILGIEDKTSTIVSKEISQAKQELHDWINEVYRKLKLTQNLFNNFSKTLEDLVKHFSIFYNISHTTAICDIVPLNTNRCQMAWKYGTFLSFA